MPSLRFYFLPLPILAGVVSFLAAYGLLWMLNNLPPADIQAAGGFWHLLQSQLGPILFGILFAIPVYISQSQREKLMAIATYDSALGHPERYRLIEETDRLLAEVLGREGRTAVVLLHTMVDMNQSSLLPADQVGSAVQRHLTSSMRPSDLVVKLEAGYVMVVAVGINTGQAAQDVMKKVFSLANDYCKAQFPEMILAVKAGGFVCDSNDSSRIALAGVFEVFRKAQEKFGDALVTDSSRRRSLKHNR